MSKKEMVLAQLRIAGYHEDKKEFTKVYIDNKISMLLATEAYNSGIKLKQKGMKCTCSKCKG